MILRSARKGITSSHSARWFSSITPQLTSSPARFTPSPYAWNPTIASERQHKLVQDMVEKSKKKAVYKNTKKMMEESYRALDMEKFQTRRWKDGDIYSPHDLSHEEMEKWKKPKRVTVDAFDTLGINPLHEYKNFAIMWEYMSSTGRILPRKETGLRRVNQRRVAKAIRRAVGMGLIPSVHKHPEMLEVDAFFHRKPQIEAKKPGTR